MLVRANMTQPSISSSQVSQGWIPPRPGCDRPAIRPGRVSHNDDRAFEAIFQQATGERENLFPEVTMNG